MFSDSRNEELESDTLCVQSETYSKTFDTATADDISRGMSQVSRFDLTKRTNNK